MAETIMLRVALGSTHHHQPAAKVQNLPDCFAELQPTQLRALAAALLAAAADCEALHNPYLPPTLRQYPLVQVPHG